MKALQKGAATTTKNALIITGVAVLLVVQLLLGLHSPIIEQMVAAVGTFAAVGVIGYLLRIHALLLAGIAGPILALVVPLLFGGAP